MLKSILPGIAFALMTSATAIAEPGLSVDNTLNIQSPAQTAILDTIPPSYHAHAQSLGMGSSEFPRFSGTVLALAEEGRFILGLHDGQESHRIYLKFWAAELGSPNQLYQVLAGQEVSCELVYEGVGYVSANCGMLRRVFDRDVCDLVERRNCSLPSSEVLHLISVLEIGRHRCSAADLENLAISVPLRSQVGGTRQSWCAGIE